MEFENDYGTNAGAKIDDHADFVTKLVSAALSVLNYCPTLSLDWFMVCHYCIFVFSLKIFIFCSIVKFVDVGIPNLVPVTAF